MNFNFNFFNILLSLHCNHKRIGLYYILVALYTSISGILFSINMRSELFTSGVVNIANNNTNFYNVNITLHGLIMVFFVIIPGLFGGLGNYLSPLVNNQLEIIFPRINNVGLLMIVISYVIIINNVIFEYNLGIGWTMYPPLSILSTINVAFVINSLLINGVSSLISSVNYILILVNNITIVLNLFYISVLVTSILLLVVVSVLASGFIMLLFDIYFNTIFFINEGDCVLYQHIFWYFGHPEVYILILPGFGIVSTVLNVVLNKLILGINSMMLAMLHIGILGNLVWGHHMYVASLEVDNVIYYTIITLLISLPTGTKIYNWLSIYVDSNHFYYINLIQLSIVFVVIFIIGGITGIVLANNNLDIILHDGYYVIAHFHYVLSIGAILSLIIGYIYISRYATNNKLIFNFTNFVVYIIFIAIVGIFTPMFSLGYNGMQRRVLDYADGFNTLNYISSIFSIIIVLCLVFFRR